MKYVYIFLAVEMFMVVYFNFLNNNKPPHIPGDILIEKPSLRIYIPFASAIVLSILVSTFLGLFRSPP